MPARTDEVIVTGRWRGQEINRGTQQVQKDMDRMRQSTERLNNALGTMGRMFGITFGIEGARRMAMYAHELAVLSSQAAVTEQTFARLAERAGTDATTQLEKMRKAVGGTLSDLELMRRVGAAVDAGLTFGQAITALEYLRRYSIAFGKDFNQLVSTIFLGLQRGSVQLVDDAGIILSATDKMYDGMSDVQKKAALVGEVLRIMREKMEVLPEITDDAVTATGRLATEWERLEVALGKIAEGPVFGVLKVLADATSAASNALEVDQQTRDYIQMRQELEGKGLVPDLPNRGTNIFGGAEVAYIHELAKRKREILDLDAERKQRLAEEAAEIQKLIKMSEEREKQEAERLKRFEESVTYRDMTVPFDGKPTIDLELIDERHIEASLRASVLEFQIFEAQLEADLAKAIGDRQTLRETEQELFVLQLTRKAHLAGKSEDEITEIIRQALEHRQDLLKEPEIRRVLLYFDADASNVKTQSDLAAYSIGLLTGRLRELHPALDSAISGIQSIIVGSMQKEKTYDYLGNVTESITSGGWASIIGGGVQILSSMFGGLIGGSREAAQRMQELRRAIEAASTASGEYARSLESMSEQDLQRQFMAHIRDLRTELNQTGGGVIKFSESLYEYYDHTGKNTAATIALVSELNRLEEGLKRFSGKVVTYQQAMAEYGHILRMEDIGDPARKLEVLKDVLGDVGIYITRTLELGGRLQDLSLSERWQIEETIADLEREKARVEIEAREEQAQQVIEALHKQAAQVQQALDDAHDAQRQALLRSVRLRFDLEEAALRESFLGRLTGARSDPAETTRVLAELSREIEVLRLAEQAAGTNELARLREQYEKAREQEERATEIMVDAVENAAKDTSTDFRTAVTEQTSLLLAGFAEELQGTVLGKPLLPVDIIDLRSQVLLDMNTLLQPVGVKPVDLATALGPMGVTLVDLEAALQLQGVKTLKMQDWFEVQGVGIVDLANALDFTGQQTVDLAQALRLDGALDVQMSNALEPVGTKNVFLATALEPVGALQIDLSNAEAVGQLTLSMDPVTSAIEAQASLLHNDLQRINAALQAGFILQFMRKSVFQDIGGFGGFVGFMQEYNRLLNFDEGGIVPGPIGRPTLAIVHGQEEVVPPGGKGSREVHVHLNVTVQGIGGSGGDARRHYRDSLRKVIIEDVRDGELGRVIKEAAR